MSDPLQGMKRKAAEEALCEVKSGMKLGLGTGSTSREFVLVVGEAMRQGKLRDITAVCTSEATEQLARSLDIPIVPLAEIFPLDLTIDGADEIDPQLRLIKGKGGALLREKIVEQSSKRFLVIADHTKLVDRLGGVPLPVEVVPFASDLILRKLELEGLGPELRRKDGEVVVTDEGNHLLDVALRGRDCAEAAGMIRNLAGVVDTGFFPHEASEALIAFTDRIERRKR